MPMTDAAVKADLLILPNMYWKALLLVLSAPSEPEDSSIALVFP